MRPLPVLRALFLRLTEGRLTPWVKQIPTVVTFVVAIAVLVLTRMPVSSWGQFAASVALVALGTLASLVLPWRRIAAPWSVLIPCASFVSIALLRLATGGSDSPFGVLLIIPVIWVASEPGAWNPLIAGVGAAFALLLPPALDSSALTLGELARDLLTPFVLLVAAVIVNEVARRVREAAEARDRVKDEFLGLVSHELRNPLTSVLGFLELLTMGPDPLTDAQRGYIDIAQRNAKRLQGLVGDLLATAQAGEGAFTLQTAPTALNDVVAQSVASAMPAAEAADVSLEAALGASVTLTADAVRLGQAVDNLISNALKFTPAGGTVTVSTGVHGEDAVITVRDTGVGIPAEELEHLSERFYRASTAHAIPGIGLGLTVVRQIATAHGGHLDVDSAEGRGTAFALALPLHPQH
ncbi:MAG: HAMP domain-containing histidine kinase [Microbacteriaceae bacterium]|nr:HAMP domain-containing histidine kinase [Microbacteriaceae bacterium]MCL2794303.1 HAMP domain-containing histidine kinase [Microbacteriaceae bacterium]